MCAAVKRSKRRSPPPVSKDFCSTKPYGLRRGEIHVLRGDSRAGVSSEEGLEMLLDRLEDQADEDAARAEASPSPLAIDKGRTLDFSTKKSTEASSSMERSIAISSRFPRRIGNG
jgi:hypothetical protein